MVQKRRGQLDAKKQGAMEEKSPSLSLVAFSCFIKIFTGQLYIHIHSILPSSILTPIHNISTPFVPSPPPTFFHALQSTQSHKPHKPPQSTQIQSLHRVRFSTPTSEKPQPRLFHNHTPLKSCTTNTLPI